MTKVQRYKVGYYTDEWGMSSNTPCLIPDDSGYAVKFEDYYWLETELTALKAELREICAAIDDPACDLVLTTVECIKRLKAENESLKRDAERLDWMERKSEESRSGVTFQRVRYAEDGNVVEAGCRVMSFHNIGELHQTLRVAIDAAMAKGEQE